MKKMIRITLTLSTNLIALFATALALADDVVKEDTTPPAPEGALSLQQTPPLMNIGKPLAAPAPQQPAAQQPTSTQPEPADSEPTS